jgi:integrase
LKAAGIEDYLRPFHDARHRSLTNGAANGESTFALMRRAGHKNVATTQRYVDLAGVVFRPEADSLADWILGGRKFYSSEPISLDLASPEPPKQAVPSLA